MSTLTFEPDLYKFQKQCSNCPDDFDNKIVSVYNSKLQKNLCQYWGCCETCIEQSLSDDQSDLDGPLNLCDHHMKTITNVFTSKLTAFISNEPDMLNRIKTFIEHDDNIKLIDHLNDLFTSKNEVFVGQSKKYGLSMDGDIVLVDNKVGLFMSYIKNMIPWLISDAHLTEWMLKTDSDTIKENLVALASYRMSDDPNIVIYYIKSLTKENIIEIICHNIAHDIRGNYEIQPIKVE